MSAVHAPIPQSATPLQESDAAKYIGLSRAFLRKARARGVGPRFLRFGRAIRYTVDDPDDYLEKHRVETRDSR